MISPYYGKCYFYDNNNHNDFTVCMRYKSNLTAAIFFLTHTPRPHTLLHQGLVRINGPSFSSQRLPNTLSISIRGLSSAKLLESLSDRLAASAGAACHTHHDDSGKHKAVISSVLEAMGVPEEFALGTLRLSVGRHSTQDDVDAAVAMIVEEVSKQITI